MERSEIVQIDWHRKMLLPRHEQPLYLLVLRTLVVDRPS